MLIGNAIVGQSGGPTAAINATLAGVIRGTQQSAGIKRLFGAFNGVEGMLAGHFTDLTGLSEEDLKLLETTPAAALGSCRRKLPPPTDSSSESVYTQLLDFFKANDIRYFFYIGGNDSMDTVAKLSEWLVGKDYEMRVMGVPKTIDNDVTGTDHTPGYGSAAKFIATSMQEILRDTAVYTVKAVTIVEIMGRDAGWLTAAAALPRKVCGVAPDLIYLPERAFSYEQFYVDLDNAFKKHPNVVIAVSEGLRFDNGRYVGEDDQSGTFDVFGHRYLSGTGRTLEMAVKDMFGCKVRSVELNLLQRCAAHIASATDLEESVRVGKAAVFAAAKGETAKMMCFERVPGKDYELRIFPEDIEKIANRTRRVPDEFINAEGNNITDAGIDYLLPLIQGEPEISFENGLPKHFAFKR